MRCLSSNSSETLALILNDQIYRQVAYYEAWHLIITSNPWKDATSISTGTMYLVLLWEMTIFDLTAEYSYAPAIDHKSSL